MVKNLFFFLLIYSIIQNLLALHETLFFKFMIVFPSEDLKILGKK